jgi:hypothetical protein
VLIDQKLLNPDYQDPSIDLLAVERKRNRSALASQSKPHLATVEKSQLAKRMELNKSISDSSSIMSIQDAYEIVNHALSTLHLD